MKKYNTQKHSQGRINNRNNKKDSSKIVNEPYLILQTENNYFYIDSIFIEDFYGNNYKSLYVSNIGEDEKNEFCLIDEKIEMNCDFMKNIEKVYSKVLEKVVVSDIDEKRKEIVTLISPSQYDSYSSEVIELEHCKGFYFSVGTFTLYNYETGWGISGHSETLVNQDLSQLNINQIKKMSSIDFFRFYKDLKYY